MIVIELHATSFVHVHTGLYLSTLAVLLAV
jgi:hypothetical protein